MNLDCIGAFFKIWASGFIKRPRLALVVFPALRVELGEAKYKAKRFVFVVFEPKMVNFHVFCLFGFLLDAY